MPGRIDDERSARELDQLATRRRVSARAVVTDLPGLEELLARERVHEGRLPDTRRAEQHGRQARGELFADLVEAGARLARDRNHRDAAGNGLDLCHRGLGHRVEVCLREHDHGSRAALPGEDQIALETPEAEILVHRGDEEGDVDVRGEHLLLGRLPRRLARELRESRQDGGDRPGVVVGSWGDDDPVADDGQVGGGLGLVDEPSRHVAAKLAVLGEHVVGTSMLDRHAAGDDVVAGERLRTVCSAGQSSRAIPVRTSETPCATSDT